MKGSKYTRPAWLKEQGDGGASPPRSPYSGKLAEPRPEIAGLRGGLGKYPGLHIFAHAHPDRFYQIGTSEQPLISATSMTHNGFMPWAKTACALPGVSPSYGRQHAARIRAGRQSALPALDKRRAPIATGNASPDEMMHSDARSSR